MFCDYEIYLEFNHFYFCSVLRTVSFWEDLQAIFRDRTSDINNASGRRFLRLNLIELGSEMKLLILVKR